MDIEPDPDHPAVLEVSAAGEAMVLKVLVAELFEADVMAALGHELRRAIHDAQADRYVLDLSRVRFLTSAAFGLILNIQAHLAQRQYGFAIVVPDDGAGAVFRASHLEQVMPVVQTLDEAVRRITRG